MTTILPSALLLAATFAAAALPCAAQNRSDPLDPKAPVPALTHRSSLATYRGLGDDPPIAWKEANDTAARIGGWRSYAREARAPAAGASAASADAEKNGATK